MSGGKNFYSSLQRWCDEFNLAVKSVRIYFPTKRFLITFIVTFLLFGVILNLLSGGSASFNLMANSDFGGKLEIIKDAFLGLFGVNRNFIDWAFIFFVSLLQAILISLVVVVYKYRKSSANLQNAGLVTGLIVLGSGCPTCGTTILAPIIISIAGSSGMAIAGTVSWVLTILSIIIALLAFKKVGFEAYAIHMEEKFKMKKALKNKKGKK